MGVSISLILIFLQPFNTDKSTISYKNLRLAGYALAILIPILALHPLENYIYKVQKRRWYPINEILYALLNLFVMLSVSYLYKWVVMDDMQGLSWNGWKGFMSYAGIPFIPILGPLWIYFRMRLGTIQLATSHEEDNKQIVLRGTNKYDELILKADSFVYARAQQNYVIIVFVQDDIVKEEMLRATLTIIKKQLPHAHQVHRSYLVNLKFLEAVKGNSRKREMVFTLPLEPIPISQKYFEALRNKLLDSSQKKQNRPKVYNLSTKITN